MMSDKIVTNLRIDKDDWQQMKILAAELGMSFNEYANYLLKYSSTKHALKGIKLSKQKEKIWQLAMLAKRNKSMYKPQKLSEDDEIIYG